MSPSPTALHNDLSSLLCTRAAVTDKAIRKVNLGRIQRFVFDSEMQKHHTTFLTDDERDENNLSLPCLVATTQIQHQQQRFIYNSYTALLFPFSARPSRNGRPFVKHIATARRHLTEIEIWHAEFCSRQRRDSREVLDASQSFC